jgi:hypothetical protein
MDLKLPQLLVAVAAAQPPPRLQIDLKLRWQLLVRVILPKRLFKSRGQNRSPPLLLLEVVGKVGKGKGRGSTRVTARMGRSKRGMLAPLQPQQSQSHNDLGEDPFR